jgi:hypothetical protein
LLKDPAVETQLALLDGCYVLETDLPAAVADARTVHARYLNLPDIERDFRTMKTGQLELRPIFLRNAERTEGHALVTMLALKLVRELDRAGGSAGADRHRRPRAIDWRAPPRPRRARVRLGAAA